MAKGLGAMLAAFEMEESKRRMKEGTTIACPLCGAEMEYNGCVWGCSSDKVLDQCTKLIELSKVFDAHCPQSIRSEGTHLDDFQGQTLCAIMKGGKPLVICCTRRGSYGRTNIIVEHVRANKHDVPMLVHDNRWVWMDWIVDNMEVHSNVQ